MFTLAKLCMVLSMAPVGFSQSRWIGTWTDSTVTIVIEKIDTSGDPGRLPVSGSIHLGNVAREVYGIAETQFLYGILLVHSSEMEFSMKSGGSFVGNIWARLRYDSEKDAMQLEIHGINIKTRKPRMVTLTRLKAQ